MFYVYLLKSKIDKKFYIGFSSDLRRRLVEHNNGGVDATKKRRPLDLIYYESYREEKLARKREINLKKFGSAYSALLKRLDYK